jgi:N-acetylglutamate synthase-like GNAT family acetyltransferase
LAEFLVCHATKDDFPAIRALIRAVQINPTGLDWQRFLVVVSPDGELLGCGQIKLHGDGSRELASIAVQEQFRGMGIARVVIEALLGQDSRRPLYLMCRARLGTLYSKFGFHAIEMDDMPPYFRKIKQVERIFNSKTRPDDRLLVMKLD